jgi:hypothetical protein
MSWNLGIDALWRRHLLCSLSNLRVQHLGTAGISNAPVCAFFGS